MKTAKKKRRRQTIPRSVKLDWDAQVAFQSMVERDDRVLGLIVQPQGLRWNVMAVETNRDANTAERVFNDHGHKVVGQYEEVEKAFDAANSFARSWLLKHKASNFTECPCEEVK